MPLSSSVTDSEKVLERRLTQLTSQHMEEQRMTEQSHTDRVTALNTLLEQKEQMIQNEMQSASKRWVLLLTQILGMLSPTGRVLLNFKFLELLIKLVLSSQVEGEGSSDSRRDERREAGVGGQTEGGREEAQ